MGKWRKIEKKIDFTCKKKIVRLSQTVHGKRTTSALCYLLTLAGHGTSSNITIINNISLYKDVTMLMTSTKALLMKMTGLTNEVAQRKSITTT